MSLDDLHARSLAAQIVESHRPARPASHRLEPGELRVDHVWMGGAAARLALEASEDAGLGRPAVDRAWVSASRDTGAAAGVFDEEVAPLWQRAGRRGVPVARPRYGASDPAYRERAAAPGRVLAWSGIDAPACGGLGTVAVEVGALEAAAVLSGLPLYWDPRGHVVWRLDGSPSAGVGGADLALWLCGGARPRSWTGQVVELGGPGVASLAVSERLAAAALLADCGAIALFPSDARTRSYLDACGRETDWRELSAEAPAGASTLELGTLEPMIAPAEDPSLARPLRHAIGRSVRRVLFGPGTDEAELETLAGALAARGRHAWVEVIVAVGSARVRDSLEASGAWAALESARVVIPEPDLPLERVWGPSRGAWLCCGVTGTARAALPANAWLVGAASAIAGGILGEVSDPREAGIAVPAEQEPKRLRVPARPEGRVPPPSTNGTAPERRSAPRVVRAVVWAVIGDDCTATRVLPRGIRGRLAAAEDPGHAFDALFPGVAHPAEAVASRDGLVIAGRAFLAAPQSDEAAWALAHAGVRAVVAESYAAGGDRALAAAGILPLIVPDPRTRSRLSPGDEVEIPGLPEGLEPGRPVVVRNLTRGLQVAARHPLDARAADVWRAGGVTGYAAWRARTRREEH